MLSINEASRLLLGDVCDIDNADTETGKGDIGRPASIDCACRTGVPVPLIFGVADLFVMGGVTGKTRDGRTSKMTTNKTR